MAAQVHLVLRNFAWRIAAITGLSTDLDMPDRFVRYSPKSETPQASTGWARRFKIDWPGGEENTAATDMRRREANHEIVVEVVYPHLYDDHDLQETIAQDLHLLDKALRRQANLVGYDDDNSTTGINLYRRQKTAEGYRLIKEDPHIWYLRIPYLCKVREVEGT